MAGFMYPRTISLRRQLPTAATTGGVKPFGGLTPTNETELATDIPCSIQFDRIGTNAQANMPGDAHGRGSWKIFIPLRSAALGLIQRNDICIDDQGQRYQVMNPVWTSLGYALRAETLVV